MRVLFSLGLSVLASVAFAQDLQTLEHQGVSRSFLIHNSQAAKSGPKPTVIALHGFRDPGQAITAEGQLDRVAWRKLDEVASQEDFITVYPGAIDGRWNYAGTSAPVRAGAGIADDIGFISKVIDQLRLEKISDRSRIYLFGFSRGAFMTFEMLCRAADYFAAAATMAGSMLEAQRDACRPVRAVPLAVFAGTDDLNVPYDGWVLPNGRLLSVPETLEFWRQQHNCKEQSAKLLPEQKPSGSRVRLVTWTGCRQKDSFRFYRIEGGGHQAPSLDLSPPEWIQKYGRRNHDIETGIEVWGFVRRFAR